MSRESPSRATRSRRQHQTEDPIEVLITREAGCEDLPLPAYETDHAAGMDIRAAVCEPLTLEPGERAFVPTGLRIALPIGLEAQIRPRSGLAARQGITMLNTPGTIDADYRGEIRLIVINLGRETYTIQRGDRVAQMIVAPVARVRWRQADALDETSRGDGGFGHTGT